VSWLHRFFSELLRRKVVRLLGAYIAVLWLLAEGFASLFPVFGIPEGFVAAFVIVGVAAIPVLAFFSWKYDVVPPQLVRDIKDVEATNPGLSWARMRHDNSNAGYILLKWTTASGDVTERRFYQPVAIGREPGNEIELPDARVSRHHAVIWAEGAGWHVRDMGSSNGTFIGMSRVNGTAPLPQHCELRFHPNGPVVGVAIARAAETLIG
jgi:hypothetical protein